MKFQYEKGILILF